MIPVVDPSRPEGDRQVTWQAFVQEFGEPKIKQLPAATSGWRIVRLEIDRRGPVGLIVTMLKEDGSPAANEPVAWYWSDADADANCGPANGVLAEMNAGRCISGRTKEDGTIDFAMGRGAYYFAPAIGPHAAWHYGADQASEVILGLGMLGETEHWHYNVVFQWTAGGEGEEVTEQPETGEEEPTEQPETGEEEESTEQPDTTETEETVPAGDTKMAVIDLMRPAGDNQVTWEAFVQEFGEPKIKQLPASASGWRVVRLEIDRRGPVGLVVTMLKEDGSPARDEPVAWYWPDADADAGCGPATGVLAEMNAGRCISGRTKEDGSVDFAMGHGAYYFAPAIGPHAVWHYGADQASEVILGLGMLGETEHWHYNVVFQWTAGGVEDTGEEVTGEGAEEAPVDDGVTDEGAADEETVDVVVQPVDEGQVRPPISYDVPFPVPRVFKGRPVTRRGVHWGSQWYHDLWIEGWADWNWEDWTRWAQEMHLSWAVLLSSGDSALSPHEAAGGRSATQILLDAGIIPLVRIGVLLPGSFTGEEQVKMLVEQVAPHNVPAFVVLGNEFGDPREWRKGEVPKDWMERAFAWWVRSARICLKHDRPEHPVIVGFPDGPDYDHDPFQVVRELPNKGYLETSDVDAFFKWWEEGKAFYAGHFYGLNRPPDYPDDVVSREAIPLTEEEHRAQLGKFYELSKLDPPLSHINLQREQKAWAKHNKPRPELTACWRSWERVAGWMKTNFGKVLPMAVTEGGWTPGAIAGTTPETLDGRWPKPSPETVAKYTLYAFDQEEHSMFAVCPWVAAGGLMQEKKDWEGDAWRSTAYLAPELDYGLDMPVVQALRDNPPR